MQSSIVRARTSLERYGLEYPIMYVKVRASATQSIYEVPFHLRFMDSNILKTKNRFKSSATKQELKKGSWEGVY